MSRLPTARQKVRKGQSELEEGGRERREDALALKAPRLRSSEPYEQPGHVSATLAVMVAPLAVLVTLTVRPHQPEFIWAALTATT